MTENVKTDSENSFDGGWVQRLWNKINDLSIEEGDLYSKNMVHKWTNVTNHRLPISTCDRNRKQHADREKAKVILLNFLYKDYQIDKFNYPMNEEKETMEYSACRSKKKKQANNKPLPHQRSNKSSSIQKGYKHSYSNSSTKVKRMKPQARLTLECYRENDQNQLEQRLKSTSPQRCELNGHNKQDQKTVNCIAPQKDISHLPTSPVDDAEVPGRSNKMSFSNQVSNKIYEPRQTYCNSRTILNNQSSNENDDIRIDKTYHRDDGLETKKEEIKNEYHETEHQYQDNELSGNVLKSYDPNESIEHYPNVAPGDSSQCYLTVDDGVLNVKKSNALSKQKQNSTKTKTAALYDKRMLELEKEFDDSRSIMLEIDVLLT